MRGLWWTIYCSLIGGRYPQSQYRHQCQSTRQHRICIVLPRTFDRWHQGRVKSSQPGHGSNPSPRQVRRGPSDKWNCNRIRPQPLILHTRQGTVCFHSVGGWSESGGKSVQQRSVSRRSGDAASRVTHLILTLRCGGLSKIWDLGGREEERLGIGRNAKYNDTHDRTTTRRCE